MTKMSAADFITGEAAPGVATLDVTAVNSKETRELYAGRKKIYSKLAHGTFRRLKWIVMAVTLGIYYALPWFRWERGSELPNQAILADVENGRIFIGPIDIWPQEFYYITGILVLSALVLFLITSALGRVWCGYTCPQTVWTDLMIAIERFWQGDRNTRIRLDKEPWSATKIYKKSMTHVSWILVSILTGGAFVFYFRDAPTLAGEFLTGTAPMIAYLFLGIFAFTTYLLGAIAREQVCIYMCPWPRIQGAMIDHHTVLVSYRPERGEPRGPARKGPDHKIDWSSRGDCIDCNACVAVCPTGIDIRDGSQLECIQCALCIDACNDIMAKVDRPQGLIAYDTIAKREASERGVHEPWKFVRARTGLYAGLIVLVTAIMAVAFLGRTSLQVNVVGDRAPLYVMLSDGGVRNTYTVKILNKQHNTRRVQLSLGGSDGKSIEGAQFRLLGIDEVNPVIEVPTDAVRELKLFVTVPKASLSELTPPSTPLTITVRDVEGESQMVRRTVFQSPVK
ncbi:MAG: cytochrome c oxidase accessory protein CcoG [Pseudomonadota bacterium]